MHTFYALLIHVHHRRILSFFWNVISTIDILLRKRYLKILEFVLLRLISWVEFRKKEPDVVLIWRNFPYRFFTDVFPHFKWHCIVLCLRVEKKMSVNLAENILFILSFKTSWQKSISTFSIHFYRFVFTPNSIFDQ